MAPAEALPDDLVEEILLRLPRRVQGLASRTSHPYFLRAHAARSPIVVAVVDTTAIPDGEVCTIISIKPLSARDDDGDGSGAAPSQHAVPLISFTSVPFFSSPFVIGTWDGVVCVACYHQYALFNPLTRARTSVPAPASRGIVICGYAHPTTSRYHLLHTDDASYPHNDTAAAVATIRILRVGENNVWRKITHHSAGVESRTYVTSYSAPPVNLHGCLHWPMGSSSSASARPLLSVFDMEREVPADGDPRTMALPRRLAVLPDGVNGDGRWRGDPVPVHPNQREGGCVQCSTRDVAPSKDVGTD
uniref:F-box domain-containing protein n=1 Tax=Oryza punctata TaxID=4537 RepID=A0A0E0KE41_ORYPU